MGPLVSSELAREKGGDTYRRMQMTTEVTHITFAPFGSVRSKRGVRQEVRVAGVRLRVSVYAKEFPASSPASSQGPQRRPCLSSA